MPGVLIMAGLKGPQERPYCTEDRCYEQAANLTPCHKCYSRVVVTKEEQAKEGVEDPKDYWIWVLNDHWCEARLCKHHTVRCEVCNIPMCSQHVNLCEEDFCCVPLCDDHVQEGFCGKHYVVELD